MFLDSYRFLQEKLSNIAKSLDFCKTLTSTFLKRKVFILMNIYEVITKTKLPPIEAFYFTFYNENISKEEYKHVQMFGQLLTVKSY